MKHPEKQYLDLLQHILDHGEREPNRTGIDTLTVPGAMLRFDLREGFPAITTKKLAFGQVKGELIGFLRGCTSAAEFRALGCTVWDQNANENTAWLTNPARKGEDDLGRVYGAQWREFGFRFHHKSEDGLVEVIHVDRVDQLARALDDVRHNRQSRRIIVTAWNPAELGQMALPPCHLLFQLLPRSNGVLHMTMYQRSH